MARQRVLKIIERKSAEGKTLYYARSSYKSRDGKRHTLWRAGATKTEARANLEKALDEVRDGQAPEEVRKTFAELAAYFEARYCIPPRYVGDRKVAGLRSYRTERGRLRVLAAHFGRFKLAELTHADIEDFRSARLDTPVRTGTPHERQRSVAVVNRELALLRRALNVAVRRGWLRVNPFGAGDSLISAADEVKRERILTVEEEGRLLAACAGKREHLRPILICALDTGMRQGEIFSLRWRGVNFLRRVLMVEAMNTKTLRSREVPVSTRLYQELARLYEMSDKHPDTSVFGVATNVKRSFAGACRDAGIEGFRFHDSRHSAASRFIRGGLSLQEVGRILGHTQAQTTFRYVNISSDTIGRAAEIVDRLHAEREEREPVN